MKRTGWAAQLAVAIAGFLLLIGLVTCGATSARAEEPTSRSAEATVAPVEASPSDSIPSAHPQGAQADAGPRGPSPSRSPSCASAG